MTAAAPATQRFPPRHAYGNLLFSCGDERVGLYRLPTSHPAAGKQSALNQLQRLAITVGPGADFSLWRVQRAYAAPYAAGHYERLKRALRPRRRRAQSVILRIPELYLAVSLREPTPAKLGGGLIRAGDRARRRLEDIAGVSAPQPISHRDLVALANLEQRTFERIGRIGAQRATTNELQWLLRRAACRGICEPRIDPRWTPDAPVHEGDDEGSVYEPLENDMWRLCSASMLEEAHDDRGADSHGARLIIDAEEGRSYQTFMTLGALADDPCFPGPRAELLYDAPEAVPFPVDAVVHAQSIGNREALSDSHEPQCLKASLTYAIGASSGRQLEQRASALQETLADVVLHRPNMMQEALFYDALPGGSRAKQAPEVLV